MHALVKVSNKWARTCGHVLLLRPSCSFILSPGLFLSRLGTGSQANGFLFFSRVDLCIDRLLEMCEAWMRVRCTCCSQCPDAMQRQVEGTRTSPRGA